MLQRTRSLWLASLVLILACGGTEPDPPVEPTSYIYFGCTFAVESGICRINPDGSAFTVLTTDAGLVTAPGVSFDGRRIAFGCPEGVCVMNADGSGRELVIGGDGGTEPTWSPDGTRLAFIRGQRIWIANADGSAPAPLTPDSIIVASPSWSPDGLRIISSEPYPGDDLWMIDATGANLTKISDAARSFPVFPRWSPDGSRVLYTSGEVASDLFITDLTGADHLQVRTGGQVGRSDWSPDGSEIVVVKFDGFTEQLYHRTLANEHLTKLTSRPTVRVVHGVDWAPLTQP